VEGSECVELPIESDCSSMERIRAGWVVLVFQKAKETSPFGLVSFAFARPRGDVRTRIIANSQN
jgi:hypothetical protein